MSAVNSLDLSPEHTGLVIVDMQREGCERHGPSLKPVIKSIRALLDRFREANGKIITCNRCDAKTTQNSPFSARSIL